MTRLFKVKFIDPKTGRGFIDGYKTARAAKADVERVNNHIFNRGQKHMKAEYIGRDKRQ